MPRGLTPKQGRFAILAAKTNDHDYAAVMAGYASGVTGSGVMQSRFVREAVDKERARLALKALPLAVNALISIVQDGKQSANSRVAAAKVIIGQTLGEVADAGTKDVSEMTAEELAHAISQIEEVASRRAINVTPSIVAEPVVEDIFS